MKLSWEWNEEILFYYCIWYVIKNWHGIDGQRLHLPTTTVAALSLSAAITLPSSATTNVSHCRRFVTIRCRHHQPLLLLGRRSPLPPLPLFAAAVHHQPLPLPSVAVTINHRRCLVAIRHYHHCHCLPPSSTIVVAIVYHVLFHGWNGMIFLVSNQGIKFPYLVEILFSGMWLFPSIFSTKCRNFIWIQQIHSILFLTILTFLLTYQTLPYRLRYATQSTKEINQK